MTDANGNLVARYDYDAWGRQTRVFGTYRADWGYAGYFVHHASKLNLTWYRAYDADLGRWVSRDPIAEQGGLNLYGYVENDPIRLTDKNGLGPLDTIGCQLCLVYKAAYFACTRGFGDAAPDKALRCAELKNLAKIYCDICKDHFTKPIIPDPVFPKEKPPSSCSKPPASLPPPSQNPPVPERKRWKEFLPRLPRLRSAPIFLPLPPLTIVCLSCPLCSGCPGAQAGPNEIF